MPDPDGSPSNGESPVWNEQFHKWEYAAGGAPDLSALAGDLLPSADDTYDIGSTSKRWSEGHFSDSIRIGDFQPLRILGPFSASHSDAALVTTGVPAYLMPAGAFIVSIFWRVTEVFETGSLQLIDDDNQVAIGANQNATVADTDLDQPPFGSISSGSGWDTSAATLMLSQNQLRIYKTSGASSTGAVSLWILAILP